MENIYALLNNTNTVIATIVVDIENEQDGIDFIFNQLNIKQIYLDCDSIKKTNTAGINYTLIDGNFVSPKPYNSWILNETKTNWIAPVQYPVDEFNYLWDETNLKWNKDDRQRI